MAEMRINLQISGISVVAGGLIRVVSGYKEIRVAQDAVLANTGKLIQSHALLFRGIAAGYQAAARAGLPLPAPGQLAAAATPPAVSAGQRTPSGPEARLERAQANLAMVLRANAPTPQIRDARGDVSRAQGAVRRQNDLLNGPSLATRLSRLVGSTRVSFGKLGGIEPMPLVSKLSSVLNIPEGKAQLLAAGLAAAAAGVKVFADGVKFAANRLGELADASRFSGGSPKEAAQLQALGLPAGQIASIARQFREETAVGSGNVFGMIARGQLGMGLTTARGIGSPNEAAPLIQAVMGLRRVGAGPNGREEQTRIVQAIPSLEPLLKVAQASDRVFGQVLKDMEKAGALADRNPAVQAASDFQIQVGRLQNNLGDVVGEAFGPFIGQAADLLGGLADAARGGGPALSGLITFLFDVGKVAGVAVRGGLQVVGFLGRLAGALRLTNLLAGLGRGLVVVGGLLGKLADGLVGSFGRVLETTLGVVGEFANWLGELSDKSGLTGALQRLGESCIWAIGKLSDLLDKIPGANTGPIKPFFSPDDQQAIFRRAAAGGDPLAQALLKNAQAVVDNTAAIKHASGTWGGGARSKAAIGGPGRIMDPEARRQWLREQVKSMGFWGR